ncbi:MAG: hypothetical protein QM831_29635 [Kofleriaceae bacterium]
MITLLLSLGGFGITPDPKPPTADSALAYAIPDADLVMQFDAVTVVPNNYKVLQTLPDQAAVKASPELSKMTRQMLNEIEGPRNLAKAMVGIDPVTDIQDMTAFVQIQAQGEPNVVLAVHGKWPAGMLDKVGKQLGQQVTNGMLDTGTGKAVAIAKDGTLLFGTTSLISARTAATWKAPSHAAGTGLAGAADMIGGKPVWGVALNVSQEHRAMFLKEHPEQNLGTDIVKRGKGSWFAVYADGIGWTYSDSTAAGLEQVAQMSEGFVDILRAAQVAPRGFAKIALASLDSYKGNPKVDALIAHKADLQKLAMQFTGDGQFKAKVDRDTKNLKLSVRLTGKSLSEVVPVGALVPFMAYGFLATRTVSSPPPPAVQQVPAVSPKPATPGKPVSPTKK